MCFIDFSSLYVFLYGPWLQHGVVLEVVQLT